MIRAGMTMRGVAGILNVNKNTAIIVFSIKFVSCRYHNSPVAKFKHSCFAMASQVTRHEPKLSIYGIISRKTERPASPPQIVCELRVALTEEWKALPRETVRRLILSMRHCIALIDSKCGCTKY